MEKDELFAEPLRLVSDFAFDARVANVFADMLERSIPFYAEQQAMVTELAQRLYQPGTRIYDLGCSLGTTLINLCQVIGPGASDLVGYDSSLPMIEKCRENIRRQGLDDRIKIAEGDLNEDLSIENASIVTLLWTLQFVRPLRRDRLIRSIFSGLVDNGALIIAEKVLVNNSHMNRFFIEMYCDFKRRRGYSDEEITRKREALENVLVPYRIDENVEMISRNGFPICERFFQYYNFLGFVAIKQVG